MLRALSKSTLVIAAATAPTLFMGGTASAAVLFTDTASFSNQLTELQGTPLLTLDKFDGTGFNVTSVTVSFTGGSLTSSGTVRNNAPNAQNFRIRTSAEQFDLDPTAGAPAALNSFGIGTGQLIGQQQYTAVPSGATRNFGPFQLVLSPSDQVFTTSSLINQFLGTGTFSFAPTTLIGLTVIGGGGNVATNLTTLASASVSITYEGEAAPPTQVPVPPAFAGLLAFGALGTWKVRRRRHQVTLEA